MLGACVCRPYLAKIERTCIQDLMDRAVVAQREPFGAYAVR